MRLQSVTVPQTQIMRACGRVHQPQAQGRLATCTCLVLVFQAPELFFLKFRMHSCARYDHPYLTPCNNTFARRHRRWLEGKLFIDTHVLQHRHIMRIGVAEGARIDIVTTGRKTQRRSNTSPNHTWCCKRKRCTTSTPQTTDAPRSSSVYNQSLPYG